MCFDKPMALPPSRLLLGLLVLHILFGISRLPHAGFAKRKKHIDLMKALGPREFHLGPRDSHPGYADEQTRKAIQRLQEETPENAVILFRGAWRGPIEFAAPLLYPRVLLLAHRLPDLGARTWLGRPVARLRFGDREEVVLLESTETQLRLRPERRGK